MARTEKNVKEEFPTCIGEDMQVDCFDLYRWDVGLCR